MDRLTNISRGMTKASDDQWRRIFKRKQSKNKPTRVCIPSSKRQTSNGYPCKLRQTKNKTTCACIPRSKRQMSNGDACKLKQTKNLTTRACIPRSKRQTSNGDACKLKQTKNWTVYLVLSVRRSEECYKC